MKIYQMEYLVCTCRTGSISKAADELLVSRPAVSRALRELEQELGVELFCRVSTGIMLTEAGRICYEECLRIQNEISRLQNKMDDIRRQELIKASRRLRIGTSYTAAYSLVDFFYDFGAEFPDVAVERTELSRLESEAALLDNEQDVVVSLVFSESGEETEYLTLGDVEFVFCCAPSHPLASRERVTAFDIRDEPLVALSSLRRQGNQTDFLFHECGLEPNITHTTTQISMMKQLIKRGKCASIKPQPAVSDDPGIAVVPFDPPRRFPMRIMWQKNRRHSSALDDFIRFSRRYFKK